MPSYRQAARKARGGRWKQSRRGVERERALRRSSHQTRGEFRRNDHPVILEDFPPGFTMKEREKLLRGGLILRRFHDDRGLFGKRESHIRKVIPLSGSHRWR